MQCSQQKEKFLKIRVLVFGAFSFLLLGECLEKVKQQKKSALTNICIPQFDQ